MRSGAGARKALEPLCRYITRPAIAAARLKRNREGQVALQLTSAYRDGARAHQDVAAGFMQRLAAVAPMTYSTNRRERGIFTKTPCECPLAAH